MARRGRACDGAGMREPIVVAVSPTEDPAEAIDLAVTTARLLGAPLVLAAAAVIAAPADAAVVPGSSAAFDDPAARCQRVRSALAAHEHLVPADVELRVRVVSARTAVSGLLDITDEVGAALLVLGASHVGPVTRALRGDVALGVMRHLGCAVLVVPAGGAAARRAAAPPTAPQVIGVAWDGTPEAADALAIAVDLARRAGGLVRLVHVTEPGASPLAAELAAATADTSAHVPAQEVTLYGRPAKALAAASEELDLLVMGSRRHGPLRRVALGSVGATLANRARCPLLVIPRGARVPVGA